MIINTSIMVILETMHVNIEMAQERLLTLLQANKVVSKAY
jgi:hypothetical protein